MHVVAGVASLTRPPCSAQRINLVRLLKLVPPEDAPKGFAWSAWTMCEAWAERCGYYTAKAGRPDVYRAAVSLLHHTGA